jgi:N-acetylmuramoyl-L-alanine amidase
VTDQDLVALLSSDEVFGLTLFGEARNQGEAGIRAVAHAIRNRVKAGRPTAFGEGYRGVCLKRKQFSCWNPGADRNHLLLMDAARVVLRGHDRRGPLLSKCLEIARETALDLVSDPDTVHGATHYYAPAGMVPPGSVPAWARGLEPACTVGDHIFYAGVK